MKLEDLRAQARAGRLATWKVSPLPKTPKLSPEQFEELEEAYRKMAKKMAEITGTIAPAFIDFMRGVRVRLPDDDSFRRALKDAGYYSKSGSPEELKERLERVEILATKIDPDDARRILKELDEVADEGDMPEMEEC